MHGWLREHDDPNRVSGPMFACHFWISLAPVLEPWSSEALEAPGEKFGAVRGRRLDVSMLLFYFYDFILSLFVIIF